MSPPALLRATTTVSAVCRRRLVVGVLVAMPLGFYAVSGDLVGRSVRSLAFGLSWALSTVAFFAAVSARDLEPRLRLAGWKRWELEGGRGAGLVVASLVLTAAFTGLVGFDHDVRSVWGVALAFAVTGVVAVAVGTAVGALMRREMEGTLVLFFLAGMPAIANPFDSWTRSLPFWSSRELSTWAVDGPEVAGVVGGLVHAGAVLIACGLIVVAFGTKR